MSVNKSVQQDAEFLEFIRNARIIDDSFMSAFFDQNIECTQFVLNVILGRDDLEVTSVDTQKHLKNLKGHDAILDVTAVDKDGSIYDIEIQRASKDASPKRARYYSSMMDIDILAKGEDYDDLPESFVIFITEKDVFRQGLPIYTVDRKIKELDLQFEDKSHIIYVNGENKSDTALGDLIHDFFCSKAEDMKNKVLADRTKELKEDYTMGNRYESWDSLIKATEHDTSVVIAISLMAEGIPLETVAKCTGLPIEEVQELAKKPA